MEFCKIHLLPRHYLLKRNEEIPYTQQGLNFKIKVKINVNGSYRKQDSQYVWIL